MRLPLLVAAALLTGLPLAAPASATSCAVSSATAEQLVSGDVPPYGQGTLFEVFDAVLVGTVTGIASEQSGPTTVTMEVVGVLGRDETPRTVEVASPDPGWINGYGFRRGTSYVVPVKQVEGSPNGSFVCDPVFVVDDAQRAYDELAPLAAEDGVPVARADAPAGATPTAVLRESDRDLDGGTALVAGGGLGALGLAGAAVWLRRRRS